MRIHKTGNTLTNQDPSSEIALLLNAAAAYIALENLSVRLLIDLSGMATANAKVITLLPTIQDSDGDPLYYIPTQQWTVPTANANALILSEPISLAAPLVLTDADQFKCGLTGTNCGTGVEISARVVVVEENTEYVEGAAPLASADITAAVQAKKTY